MQKHLFYILKLVRPRQWIKNLALFTAIIFGGQLFDVDALSNVVVGFIAFTFLSSATYIFNDILDAQKDKLHPFKKNRPIASGKISMGEAVVLFSLALFLSYILIASIGGLFLIISLLYLGLQVSYSLIFKNVAVFDIMFIATGYILRVLAGEVISGYHISVWLLLTTISLSLFLAVGKRRSELTLLKNFNSAKLEEVRKSLSHYSENLLDAFSTMFATSTFVLYSMFTFLENPSGVKINLDLLMPDFLPSYLQRKWLMITIFPVIYGLMRYMQDIYEKSEGESPERVLWSDKSLLSAVILWVLLVVFVIYFMAG